MKYPELSIHYYYQVELDFCLIRSSNERNHILAKYQKIFIMHFLFNPICYENIFIYIYIYENLIHYIN